MTGPVPLLASYWAACGDVYPGGLTEASSIPFAERVHAIAEQGFAGLGLAAADVESVRDAIGYPAMRKLLDGAGLEQIELEYLCDWFVNGAERTADDARRKVLMEAAGELGVRHLKATGSQTPGSWSDEQIVDEFGTLCDEAAAAGTSVTLEFMPVANIKTISHAASLVRRAGRSNGSVLVDIWHVVRGGLSYDEVTALGDAIGYVELSDAAAEIHPEGMWHDTIHERAYVGDGSFDISGFLAAVQAAGYSGPYGVEVISARHRVLPLAEGLGRLHETTARFF